MRHPVPHHESLYTPIICNLGVMNQYLIWRSLDLGLVEEAKQLRRVDAHLAWLLKQKTSAFNFVNQLTRGRTLLVGEGNLSFAVSLLEMEEIDPCQLIATTFENQGSLPSQALENAKTLRSMGTKVLYGVDATSLAETFGALRFDHIVFQFPHAGSREPVEGHNPNFILVRDFLISAAFQLAHGGAVLISAVDSPHYHGAFQFEDAAEIAGFLPPEVYSFDPFAFPSYEHTMTHEDGSVLENHDEFSTWVFRLP